jgi:FrmR/RcnR family transcriptional regulator, repressor of frmRAB operon
LAHVIRDKNKLLNRVRRIKGQVDAVERSLEEGAECSDILHSIAACRGAIDGLMAEVIEGHIRFHVEWTAFLRQQVSRNSFCNAR